MQFQIRVIIISSGSFVDEKGWNALGKDEGGGSYCCGKRMVLAPSEIENVVDGSTVALNEYFIMNTVPLCVSPAILPHVFIQSFFLLPLLYMTIMLLLEAWKLLKKVTGCKFHFGKLHKEGNWLQVSFRETS